MSLDDVVRLAREAGMKIHDQDQPYMEMLERFAALVAAAEREACAKVCEELGASTNGIYERNIECAAAIRARISHA